jgi:hypothetical protein
VKVPINSAKSRLGAFVILTPTALFWSQAEVIYL